MTHWGWAALVLMGCSYDATFFKTSGLDDLRAQAETAWADVGVPPPTGYGLVLLDPADLAKACGVPADPNVESCSFPGVVLLSRDADFAEQVRTLTHELGHVLRGPGKPGELDRRHLACPESDRGEVGPDVMCPTGAAAGEPPTARDVAFVRSARRR